MLDERKLAVLRAIVSDYVSSREPVGSKALVERHELGVSSATIRNDMAVLEDEGYLIAPHTSAGRIPTDKGYRLFVDQLMRVRPLSLAERRAIDKFLGGPVELDEAVERAVRLLAQFTRQLAVVQYPTIGRSRIRHIELVGLTPNRLLIVMIFDTGRVDQRHVELTDSLNHDLVTEVRDHLNRHLAHEFFEGIETLIHNLCDEVRPECQSAVTEISQALALISAERRDDRIVFAGAANLARERDDFGHSLDGVLDALEEQMVLLRLLGETQRSEVAVRIGRENHETGITGASVVTTGYGSDARVVAQLGVVGPTRMDYASSMAVVDAVARYLGRIVSETQ